MKANELMIGDWVDTDLFGYERITAISGSELVNVNHTMHHSSNLNGIPLTADILEKNGFDVSDGEVMRYNYELNGRKESFVLRQFYDKNTNAPNGFAFFVCDVLTMFDYVHQLQHALRLCGLNELADNFEV